MATRSRVKFGGQDNDDGREIEDLRAAVKEDCVKLCTQHFGLLPDLQLVSVDTIGQDEAYRAAQAQLQRAAPLFKDIAKTAQAIKGLGEKGRVSSEAVKVAERI
ncbi:MAG TPA: hypothetical protein VER04_01555, partial [Polyangiaceae bacterium]|nr:hypothetical protein [Polyangiaceae bacterium]